MMTVTYKTINYICDEFTLVNMAWLTNIPSAYVTMSLWIVLFFNKQLPFYLYKIINPLSNCLNLKYTSKQQVKISLMF
jgi:hypothetical protein